MIPGSLTADARETLRLGDTSAEILPQIGAKCVSFRVGGCNVVEPVTSIEKLLSTPAAGGCPVLFPFPGLLADARYQFRGHDYVLPANAPHGPGHQHGFVSRKPWRVLGRTSSSITCVYDQTLLEAREQTGYPWPFLITVTWSLGAGVLRLDVQVVNHGQADLPFGFGLHPYLSAGDADVVSTPARQCWMLDTVSGGFQLDPTSGTWPWAKLPQGLPVRLTGLPAGIAQANIGPQGVRFPAEAFSELVVWRPPERTAICLEPWTSRYGAAVDLLPGEPHGLVLLAPGATWASWIELFGQRA